jgi:Trk K+ transport system NAD-binding subunit
VLIVGSSTFSRLIAKYLKDNNRHVVVVDNNKNNITEAKNIGLDAFTANVFADDLMNNIELNDIGYLMALTGNTAVNKKAIENFQRKFGEKGTFRVISPDEMKNPENNPKEGLFSHTDDYIKLVNLTRRYPNIHEINLNSNDHYNGLIEISKTDPELIPIFVKRIASGDLDIIPSDSGQINVEKDDKLIYIGKEMKKEASVKVAEEDVSEEEPE